MNIDRRRSIRFCTTCTPRRQKDRWRRYPISNAMQEMCAGAGADGFWCVVRNRPKKNCGKINLFLKCMSPPNFANRTYIWRKKTQSASGVDCGQVASTVRALCIGRRRFIDEMQPVRLCLQTLHETAILRRALSFPETSGDCLLARRK